MSNSWFQTLGYAFLALVGGAPAVTTGLSFTGALIITVDEAQARRFRMNFSSRAAVTTSRAATRPVRSSQEIARSRQIESRINWSEAGKKGLDVVKVAIEQVLQNAMSSPGSPPTSKTAFTDGTLSLVELEACVREAKWLDDLHDVFDAKEGRSRQQRDRIDTMAREIEAARTRVNRSSRQSVDAFNARIEEHRRLVSHYNGVMLPDIRREQDAYNMRVRSFNLYCNSKRYYADELAAIETKLGFKSIKH